MMRDDQKQKRTVWILSAVIIVLVLILAFFFVVQPQKIKYDNNRMLEGIDYYIGAVVLPQLQTNGYVQIPIGNETLVLVPYVPEEQATVAE